MRKLLLAAFLTAVLGAIIVFIFASAALMSNVQSMHHNAIEQAAQ